MSKSLRVCYVLCYKDPNYIRSQTLLAALEKISGLELLIVKNSRRGLLRYLEVPLKLLAARLRHRPDVFIVGFRGHEVFWLLYPAMIGKRIIFDEFINLHDWLVSEHKKLREGSTLTRLIDGYMKWVFRRSNIVITDTDAHAQLTVATYGLSRKKIAVVPVGADEEIFYPRPAAGADKFEVLFYGSMLPLHGIDMILDAAALLASKDKYKDLHFTLVGGRDNPQMLRMVKAFIESNKLKNVRHLPWVSYGELPRLIAAADLGLAGPFGGTGQARRVITGKTFQFLAMGKPALIGKTAAAGEFEDKVNSLLVNQADSWALAEAIGWAYDNRGKLEAIGQAGRRLYEDKFSIRVIGDKLNTLLVK
jgi:glycosyltransferase involved in cell wall biosynthesis